MATKTAAKKAAPKKATVKKPVAKKAVAKKPVAKKTAPVAKPVAKRPHNSMMDELIKRPVITTKKPMRKLKPGKRVKPQFKRVPPRIIQKPKAPAKPAPQPVPQVDTAKAVAFAMSIAQEMKRSSAAPAKTEQPVSDIRLSRRPTTRAQGKTTEKFPAADLKDFRKRLIDARTRALGGVTAMKATGFNDAEDHEADGGDGTNQTLRLQALGQMGAINRTLQQIEEALHRIDEGTYGVCTVCGQLIRKPRLLNQPFVLTCMECQNEMERNSR